MSYAISIHYIFELYKLHSWLFTQAVMHSICFLLQMPSPSFSTLYAPRRWKLCQGIHFPSVSGDLQLSPGPGRDGDHQSQGASSAASSLMALCFYFLICHWPQLLPAGLLHLYILQSAVADISSFLQAKGWQHFLHPPALDNCTISYWSLFSKSLLW